ncbi:MAG TPA: hypothetical protein VJ761_20500 [Ktedonobacteraceae bacterium]|nr:hypothetical protein [Ktedonobacteraceae bacterium]
MTRKDSEKDAERPHYYSQFWLDVAAGRRVIGGPKPEDGIETSEPELPEPIALRRSGRTSAAPISDGHRETRPQAVVEPTYAPDEEEEMEPEPDEADLTEDLDDLGVPNIDVDEAAEDTDFPDLDLMTPEAEEEEEEEEEDFFDEEDEDEEEDDDWAIGRGRKKPKPGRQAKPPKPTKKPRRDTRRGF